MCTLRMYHGAAARVYDMAACASAGGRNGGRRFFWLRQSFSIFFTKNVDLGFLRGEETDDLTEPRLWRSVYHWLRSESGGSDRCMGRVRDGGIKIQRQCPSFQSAQPHPSTPVALHPTDARSLLPRDAYIRTSRPRRWLRAARPKAMTSVQSGAFV